jgi:hypothetical protein
MKVSSIKIMKLYKNSKVSSFIVYYYYGIATAYVGTKDK